MSIFMGSPDFHGIFGAVITGNRMIAPLAIEDP
jgi:hypothetical protein